MSGEENRYILLSRIEGAKHIDEPLGISFNLTSIGVTDSNVYFILDIDTEGVQNSVSANYG